MPTTNKWLDVPITGRDTTMNGKVVMYNLDVLDLPSWVWKNPIESVVFGEYTKWCSNLTWYPFNIIHYNPNPSSRKHLSVGGVESNDIYCRDILPIEADFGYFLGSYHYPIATSFTDYEPYTRLQLWLPFYGLADIKIAEVQGKYIQIRLYIDFATGQAQYVIGVNPNNVTCSTEPFLRRSVNGTTYAVDDTNTRIIGTYVFNIGYDIPITSSGMADTLRNISMATLKGAATIGASAIASATGADKVTSVRQDHTERTVMSRGDKGRLRQQAKISTDTASKTTQDYAGYARQRRISTASETATAVLEGMAMNPQVDKCTSSILNSATCRSVMVIKRKVVPTVDRTSVGYLRFYGAPLGQVKTLGDLTGYTEVSEIHFEGEGFSQATAREIAMLEQAFSDGVIL